MKTDDLIAALASGVERVPSGTAGRRQLVAAAWAAGAALLLMGLFLGVRPDLAEAAGLPMFWVKLAFPIAVATIALRAAERLSRPGTTLGRLPATLAGCILAVWLLAVLVWAGASSPARADLLFGTSWYACPLLIAGLSLPGLVATLRAMRQLAPIRLPLAGGAAGLLAGGIGAAAYALYCDEMGAPFLAVWYLLGMLIPAAAGALLAPRMLRW